MVRFHLEQGLVLTLGFFLGAALAMCIAPGDIVLWIAAGLALSIFARAFFIRDLSGELFWPIGHQGSTTPKASGQGSPGGDPTQPRP